MFVRPAGSFLIDIAERFDQRKVNYFQGLRFSSKNRAANTNKRDLGFIGRFKMEIVRLFLIQATQCLFRRNRFLLFKK